MILRKLDPVRQTQQRHGVLRLAAIAQAILDLRLHRLTGLEQEKLIKEFEEILKQLKELLEILENPDRLMAVIREELAEVKERFGDERRLVGGFR